MNPRPNCTVIVPDQYRAAVAGNIISPTAISVPNVLNAANRFSTNRNIKPCSTIQGRLTWDSKNTGSQVLMINGRRINAKVTRVTVATPPTKIIDASSTPRIDPKRKLLRGTAEPAAERIKIPMAKAIR